MTTLGNASQCRKSGRYARLMGDLWRHQKLENVGDAALGLLLRLWSFCADQGVDHVSEKRMVDLFRGSPNGRRQLKQLIAAELVDEVPGGGYAPHDWYEHNRVTKPVKLRIVPKPAVMNVRGLCDDDVMSAPPETITKTPLPRARASTQDPGIKSSDPSDRSVSAPAEPPKPTPQVAPPKPPPSAETRAELAALEARYEDPELVADARQGCANARKNGRLTDAVWLAVLRRLAAHPVDAVRGAMREFVDNYADGDKREEYLLAMARSRAKRGGGPRSTRPRHQTGQERYATVPATEAEILKGEEMVRRWAREAGNFESAEQTTWWGVNVS